MMKVLHVWIGGMPVALNHAQFLMVSPTVAVVGMVKSISKYWHAPAASVPVLVAVTTLPTMFTVMPPDTVPTVGVPRAVGTVSVTVNDVIGVVPLLQIHMRYLPEHPGCRFVYAHLLS